MSQVVGGIRPLLRWAGSKRQLLPLLAKYWDGSHARYVEPFAGSCSLFYRIQPHVAVLADKNTQLIHTYRVLRARPRALHAAVLRWSPSASTYKAVRKLRPADLPSLERAARFLYLNRNCFNGIFRTNLRGEFNVPFAGSRQGAVPALNEFVEAATLLRRTRLRAWDFGTTLRYCHEGDFVYLDPPYAVESRRVFRQYGPHTFERKDLDRLAAHLVRLNERKVAFLMSYADCREARELAKTWRWRRVRVRRHISGFVSARRRSYELLITNLPLEAGDDD